VFALVSDLRRKALLNSNIRVIRVELEGGEPIREGSVFYHRFEKEGRIVEYRSRCIRCEPPQRFTTRGETDPAFEVSVTVEPVPGGCRLTQREALEVGPEALDALEPPPVRGVRDLARWLLLFPGARALAAEVRALQRERLTARLRGELQTWLGAIWDHLESPGPGSAVGVSGEQRPLVKEGT
jgi:hypothetical protein